MKLRVDPLSTPMRANLLSVTWARAEGEAVEHLLDLLVRKQLAGVALSAATRVCAPQTNAAKPVMKSGELAHREAPCHWCSGSDWSVDADCRSIVNTEGVNTDGGRACVALMRNSTVCSVPREERQFVNSPQTPPQTRLNPHPRRAPFLPVPGRVRRGRPGRGGRRRPETPGRGAGRRGRSGRSGESGAPHA